MLGKKFAIARYTMLLALAALLSPMSPAAQYAYVEVTLSSHHCPGSQHQPYNVSVTWGDPSKPSPPDYIQMVSYNFGRQQIGVGDSGQTTVDGLEESVEYFFYLYNSQGDEIASNQVYCPTPGP